ncbi:multidrug DMT transporter permease, partial [Escherichia coli]|nr:multidrug DMT transporter permease [Escherichia coli]
VIGDDLQTQRSRLRDALRAPGAGELMHPDYGTLNVLINSFESRYNASEQGTVEFTINVIPASDDTAPSVAEDTAAALEQKSGSAMSQLFNTLSDGWTVISDGLHDVQAMTDTISDKIDALENAVSGMGIVQDISAFTASFTALKGNAAALINSPRRMAESLAGMFAVLTGLPGDPSLSLTGKAATPSGSLTTNRDSMTEQAMPQLYRTLSSLRYTLSGQDDPQILIGLTPAAQKNICLLRTVMQSATLVSQAQTVGKLLDQVVRQSATHVQDTDREGGLAWLESSADVQRINRDLSDALEQQVLDLSAQGHTGTALALRDARLALTEDLTTRSVHLPGASQVMVRTTEPALVTLYRATGNSRRWQYFVRRNNIPDPVFVPGGRSVEVISEQHD